MLAVRNKAMEKQGSGGRLTYYIWPVCIASVVMWSCGHLHCKHIAQHMH